MSWPGPGGNGDDPQHGEPDPNDPRGREPGARGTGGSDWPPSGSDGWSTWESGNSNLSLPAKSRHPAGTTQGASPDFSALPGLAMRQLVVPGAAILIVVLGVVVSFAFSGGTSAINSSSDSELCSAYSAAERSWDSFSTDASAIDKLGSVARRHSDEGVRQAGTSLGNLSGMFSYGRYASIVTPIESRC